MHIGIDLSVIQSTKSGVDWYTHHVIKEIMGLLGPDERLFLFTNRETGFEKEAFGSPRTTVVMSPFPYQEPWRQFILPALLRKHEIDVCLFTNFVLSVAADCPMVLTIHDLSFKLYPRTHSFRNVMWARSLVPVSTRRASRIIADSHNTKLDLLQSMSVSERKVSVVHLGASELFSPEPEPGDEEALSRYGIVKPYVLSVGTLEPRKNLTALIRAFDMLAESMPHTHLVLAGRKGWMAQSIFNQLEKSEPGRIHVTGYVQDGHLPALYRGAAAFIYPSLYEGFGLPPLEAMSSGTPVIVSKNSSLPEVVGDAGLYVNPFDPAGMAGVMEKVLGDQELAATLREKGLARARQFSWRKTAEKTLEIIRDAARI